MIDDLNKELKTITQKWVRIPGGPCLWLRKWGNKNNDEKQIFNNCQSTLNIENNLIAISNGGGLIATYQKTYSNFAKRSKYLNIFSPDLHFLHKILLKIQKPPNDETEWFNFSDVSYISFTPDELIVVLLDNLTVLIFNNIGALINYSTYKCSNITRSAFPKLLNARLVSYSLVILTTNQTIFYISDVRKPVWFTSMISDVNQSSKQNFDFIPLNDFTYPLLFYIADESTICANLGIKSKNIKIPDHKILGLSISPDFANIACIISSQVKSQYNSEDENIFYVLFSDRQFNPSNQKKIPITSEKFNGISNADSIVSGLSNFLNFCWCGKSSIIINFVKYCVLVDISGGVCVIENPASQLLIHPEIDGARVICQNDFFTLANANNNSNNDKNQKKTPKLAFQIGHNFISIVPELLESVFKKKCTDLFQNYIEWTHGSFKEENASNFDSNSLKENIESFIEASKYITEKNIQQVLLGTSWFCQSFLSPMKRIPTENDKKLAKTYQKVRILHLLREDIEEKITNSNDKEILYQNPELNEKAFKKMFITYEEMEFLTFPTIINRLCNRGAHVTALVISEIVEEEKSSIFNHKALMSIYREIRLSLQKPKRKSSKKVVEQITKDLINLDYAQLAMAALKFGDKSICLELLEKEEDKMKKMPVLLLLGDVKSAFSIAVESNDQRMINYVAQYAVDHDKIDDVTSYYNKALLPLARFDHYDNKQIELLIFLIRNMKINALLTYLFSILKKKLLPPDDIVFELINNLKKNNLHHYNDCFTKYIILLKWINEKGDDHMRSIISSGITTNVRPIVKYQNDSPNRKLFASDNKPKIVEVNEPEVNVNEGVKLMKKEEQNDINFLQNQSINQENESDSKSKQNVFKGQTQNQNQETDSKSESENQSESKSKSKFKLKQISKKKLKTKQKAKKESSDTDSDSDSDQEFDDDSDDSDDDDDDDDSELEQSMKKGKKKKIKDKKKEKKKIIPKKKVSKKETKEENDKKKLKNKNYRKADEKSVSKSEQKDDIPKKEKEVKTPDNSNDANEIDLLDELKNTEETQKDDDNSNKNDQNSDENKQIDDNRKDEEKLDEEDESKEKKKDQPTVKTSFLISANQKIKKEDEKIKEDEVKKPEKKQNAKEIDQLQFNYGPKLRNNVSAMKAIEFELSNGRRYEADKLASILELPEPRYIWLLINFYLRTNAHDTELLQLSQKISLIDGLWAVRRCIVLNRLNIAASFLENISNPEDKKQARIELQRIITSKQQCVSKVDVKNIFLD